MGWNSWDCFGPTVTEAEVKANADYMAAKLKPFGWDYIVVDIRWYVANDKAHGYNEKDPNYLGLAQQLKKLQNEWNLLEIEAGFQIL